jgi:hypothetical protein
MCTKANDESSAILFGVSVAFHQEGFFVNAYSWISPECFIGSMIVCRDSVEYSISTFCVCEDINFSFL